MPSIGAGSEFVENGTVAPVLAIGRNVTDRVQAQQVTRQSNQLMQSVLDALAAQNFGPDACDPT